MTDRRILTRRGRPDVPVWAGSSRLRALAGSRMLGPVGLLAAVTVWTLWRVGPVFMPILDYVEWVALTWPTSPVEEAGAFGLHSPLGYLFYRGLPFRSPRALGVEHAMAIAVSYLAFAGFFGRELGWRRGLMATSVLVLSPVTAALLLGIGMYDAFTMLAWAVVFWTYRSRWPFRFAAGVLLGLQNAEQGAVALILLMFLRPLVPRAAAAPTAVAALAGCAVGKFVVDAYLAHAGAVSGSRMTYLLDWALLEPSLSSMARLLPLVIWSGLAGLWCFVALVPTPEWTPQNWVRVWIAAGIWLTVGTVTQDHTRVLTLTALPVVVLSIADLVAHHFDTVGALLRTWRFWVLALSPPIVVYLGDVLPLGWKGLP